MELLTTFNNPTLKFEKKKNIQNVFELLADKDETDFKLGDPKVQLGNFFAIQFSNWNV